MTNKTSFVIRSPFKNKVSWGKEIQIQVLFVVPCCLREALVAACVASWLCGTRVWVDLVVMLVVGLVLVVLVDGFWLSVKGSSMLSIVQECWGGLLSRHRAWGERGRRKGRGGGGMVIKLIMRMQCFILMFRYFHHHHHYRFVSLRCLENVLLGFVQTCWAVELAKHFYFLS